MVHAPALLPKSLVVFPSPQVCQGQALEVDLLGNGRFTKNDINVKRVPKATIQTVSPTRLFRTGGRVMLMGHSIVNTSYLKCMFHTAPERGLNDAQVACCLPCFTLCTKPHNVGAQRTAPDGTTQHARHVTHRTTLQHIIPRCTLHSMAEYGMVIQH